MFAEVLSITAIVLSGASLAWQVITWRGSGARVKVSAVDEGYDDKLPGSQYVRIVARNVGRSAVTVNDYGLLGYNLPLWLPGSQLGHHVEHGNSAPIPYRLEPGSDAAWYLSTAEVVKACKAQRKVPEDLYVFVNLADGREIRSRSKALLLRDWSNLRPG